VHKLGDHGRHVSETNDDSLRHVADSATRSPDHQVWLPSHVISQDVPSRCNW